jgi:hypothetical protein
MSIRPDATVCSWVAVDNCQSWLKLLNSFSEPFADRFKPEGGADGIINLALDFVALFQKENRRPSPYKGGHVLPRGAYLG